MLWNRRTRVNRAENIDLLMLYIGYIDLACDGIIIHGAELATGEQRGQRLARGQIYCIHVAIACGDVDEFSRRNGHILWTAWDRDAGNLAVVGINVHRCRCGYPELIAVATRNARTYDGDIHAIHVAAD